MKELPKEILFHNRQRIGDILVFTCAVRDFKKAFPQIRVNVVSTAKHIWDNNPNIDRSLISTEENIIRIGPGILTNASNRLDWHFVNAYRMSIEEKLCISIPQGPTKPDIWLTEEEYNAPPITKRPYWIIIIGGEKGWGCKMYPFERWQEFVSKNPNVLFYQLGNKSDDHPRLQGGNIVDYIGKTENGDTGIRDLFKLFLNAEGSIGLVSFHMHLSAAFNKPCIVVAGAREPARFTRYPGHRYLAMDGCLPCAVDTACWYCNIDRCKDLVVDKSKKEPLDRKLPKCVDIIRPEDLTIALSKYYAGGRLKKGIQSTKPKFGNVIKVEIKTQDEKPPTTKYGLDFGVTMIEPEDWEFMEPLIDKHSIKTVLEFGCGLSTLLMIEKGLKVVSYETSEKWAKKVRALNDKCDIRIWDGKSITRLSGTFDLAFVDGPPGAGMAGFPEGGSAREQSTKIASECAKYLMIHDAGRKPERMWQEKYVVPSFKGPLKGGRRCHFWEKSTKKDSIPVKTPIIDPQDSLGGAISKAASRYVKLVSTARGWGGCGRSITTIMKHLLKQGHKVEFIPFRNFVGSQEFKHCLETTLKDVVVTENYSTIGDPCDTLLVYSDDFIWDFDKPEIVEAFSNIKAERKIMMLNYRRGKTGQLEWTQKFDKYMFLNSIQEKELLKVLPGVKTKILAPCVELGEFFKAQPGFYGDIRIVRHNSQGDTKFAKATDEAREICKKEIKSVLNSRMDLEMHMMPGPSFMDTSSRFIKYRRNNPPIPEFLSKGNLFWYSLPQGYPDQGPRVILEAMASGLPVVADNWSGAVDRVTKECGWLCDTKEQHIDIIKSVTLEELKKKGRMARERARQEFVPEKWIEEIIAT